MATQPIEGQVINLALYESAALNEFHRIVHNLVRYGKTQEQLLQEVRLAVHEMGGK